MPATDTPMPAWLPPAPFSELGARPLEADGAGVGDVVTDDVQRFRGAVQAAQALLERHVLLLNM
jgi:hypothetical protein